MSEDADHGRKDEYKALLIPCRIDDALSRKKGKGEGFENEKKQRNKMKPVRQTLQSWDKFLNNRLLLLALVETFGYK